MESPAKLIYKTHLSNLPTTLPVYFYGLPNGKVYIIYSRFYEIDFNHTALEFVFAIHREFSFDFLRNKLISVVSEEIIPECEIKRVDKPNPKIKIIKVSRKIKSYSEAVLRLEKKALKKSKTNDSKNI